MAPGTEPPADSRAGHWGISYARSYYTLGIISLNIEIEQPEVRGAHTHYEPPQGIETNYRFNICGSLLYLLAASADLPLSKPGTSTCTGGDWESKLVPGATVRWTPLINGPCDYVVLRSTRPEIVANSRYRLVPFEQEF